MKPFKEAEDFQNDLQAAYDYYSATYGSAAARNFLAAYESAANLVIAYPLACRVRRTGWRQKVIEHFPNYSIFYKEFPGFWLFGGIVSTLQDPDTIQARLLIREVRPESEEPI